MTGYKAHIDEYKDVEGAYVRAANGHRMEIRGKGKVKLNVQGNKGPGMTMHEVLHVPELNKSLFSVRQCTSPGNNTIEFEKNRAVIKHDNKPILTVQRMGKLYAIANADYSPSELALSAEYKQ